MAVQERDGVVGEECAVRAGGGQAIADILRGIVGRRGIDEKAAVNAGKKRAMGASREVALELKEAR